MKRFDDTFFVLCDEFEEIAAFKGRLVDMFQQTGAVKVWEEFSADDIKLYLRNRVSLRVHGLLFVALTLWELHCLMGVHRERDYVGV